MSSANKFQFQLSLAGLLWISLPLSSISTRHFLVCSIWFMSHCEERLFRSNELDWAISARFRLWFFSGTSGEAALFSFSRARPCHWCCSAFCIWAPLSVYSSDRLQPEFSSCEPQIGALPFPSPLPIRFFSSKHRPFSCELHKQLVGEYGHTGQQ